MITSNPITQLWTSGGTPAFTNGDPVFGDVLPCADADQLAIAVRVEGTQEAIVRLYWSTDASNPDAVEVVELTPTIAGGVAQYEVAVKEWRVPVTTWPPTPTQTPPMITRPVCFPFFAIGVYAAGATIAGDKVTCTILRQRQSPLQAGG